MGRKHRISFQNQGRPPSGWFAQSYTPLLPAGASRRRLSHSSSHFTFAAFATPVDDYYSAFLCQSDAPPLFQPVRGCATRPLVSQLDATRPFTLQFYQTLSLPAFINSRNNTVKTLQTRLTFAHSPIHHVAPHFPSPARTAHSNAAGSFRRFTVIVFLPLQIRTRRGPVAPERLGGAAMLFRFSVVVC